MDWSDRGYVSTALSWWTIIAITETICNPNALFASPDYDVVCWFCVDGWGKVLKASRACTCRHFQLEQCSTGRLWLSSDNKEKKHKITKKAETRLTSAWHMMVGKHWVKSWGIYRWAGVQPGTQMNWRLEEGSENGEATTSVMRPKATHFTTTFHYQNK